MNNTIWRRYIFKTKSIDDYRPLVFDAHFPWWCSGNGEGYVVIVAFLPINEPLEKYWDDAFDINFTEHDEIQFTERFPQPKYFIHF